MSCIDSVGRVPVIYLAGGMKGDWQDQVMASVKGAIFIDPRKHGLSTEAEYTAWDLAGVDRADAILGFMNDGNPGGAGLAVEFGWGAARGKHLMLVEQGAYAQQRYFGMVRAVAHQRDSHPSYDEAVQLAKTMLTGYIESRRQPA